MKGAVHQGRYHQRYAHSNSNMAFYLIEKVSQDELEKIKVKGKWN